MQKLTWNSSEQAYFGTTSSGKTIRVEAVEMIETVADAVASQTTYPEYAQDIRDADLWTTVIGVNQNVSYV